jgi:hypothetical protein
MRGPETGDDLDFRCLPVWKRFDEVNSRNLTIYDSNQARNSKARSSLPFTAFPFPDFVP